MDIFYSTSIEDYYELNFLLSRENFSINDIENLYPFEREIYHNQIIILKKKQNDV